MCHLLELIHNSRNAIKTFLNWKIGNEFQRDRLPWDSRECVEGKSLSFGATSLRLMATPPTHPRDLLPHVKSNYDKACFESQITTTHNELYSSFYRCQVPTHK